MSIRLIRRSLLLPLILACGSPTAPEAAGIWGGTDVSLTLDRSGGALSYACGAGTIDSAWAIRSDGRFTATGQHFFGGGPIPPEGHPPHPAVYSGRIQGASFTLTVTLTDLDQKLGPFHLLRGGPPVHELCL